MVEVRLHGPLAKAFGMRWMLDISTPAEAIQAIEANKPGIRKLIMALSDKGMVFRVRSKHHDYGDDDVHATLGRVQRIDFIPIVKGANTGVRFVVGAILVVVGVVINAYSWGGGAPVGNALIGVGVSMMVGAVTEWLTPTPKKKEVTADAQSWTLSGPSNTADQGYPVPIIYGEVLTGGYPVSGGISASQLNSGGTLDADVAIVGERDPIVNYRYWLDGPVQSQPVPRVQLRLYAQTFNLGEPITYQWTYNIPDAVEIVAAGLNSATMTLTVTLPRNGTPNETPDTLLGTVGVTVTGLEQDRSGEGTPAVLTRSASTDVSVRTWVVALSR